jgi:uncharacterized protein (TIGR00266 family)
MKFKISGDNLQVANVSLAKGDIVNAEAGAMVYKSGNVTIDVESKGMGKAFKRILTGESLFLTKFKSVGGSGLVGFGGRFPGKIKSLNLKKNETIIAEKGAYLCSDSTIDIGLKIIKKIGAGLFGGEGIFLQEVKGPGNVLLHAAGDLIEYNLKKGQRLDVDTSHLVAFDPTVDYDIRRVGGIKTTVFGGEGLFLAQMTGPGRVILQSMTKNMLTMSGMQHAGGATHARSSGANAGGDIVGGILRGMAKR